MNHRSYTHNLSSWEFKAEKKNQAWTGFKPLTSVILVQWYQYIAMGKQWFLNLKLKQEYLQLKYGTL